jgi:uncharacterized HAD superfamily protein
MRTKELYQEISQALSALSDAQELIQHPAIPVHLNRLRRVNDLVKHAKRHLLAVTEADEHGYAEAMRDLPITCTLPQEDTN